MRFVTTPSHFIVELRSGDIVDVWADGFGREGDYYTFVGLFDLEDGEDLPPGALVEGETPSNPARFILAVARFPKNAVHLPDGREDWPAISGG